MGAMCSVWRSGARALDELCVTVEHHVARVEEPEALDLMAPVVISNVREGDRQDGRGSDGLV